MIPSCFIYLDDPSGVPSPDTPGLRRYTGRVQDTVMNEAFDFSGPPGICKPSDPELFLGMLIQEGNDLIADALPQYWKTGYIALRSKGSREVALEITSPWEVALTAYARCLAQARLEHQLPPAEPRRRPRV